MPNITDNTIQFEGSWGNKFDRGKVTKFILELPRSEMAAGMVLWGWTELEIALSISADTLSEPAQVDSCVVGPIRTSKDGSCKVTFETELSRWNITPQQQVSFDETPLYITVTKLEEEM